MYNPLLSMKEDELPPFDAIRPEHVEPAIEAILADNRRRVEALLDATTDYRWDNLVMPLELLDERLSRTWAPVSHLNAVRNEEKLREAYNACLPKLSEYATEMGQNERLYFAFRRLKEKGEYERLDSAQRKIIDNALRDFRLSGVELTGEARERFKAIQQELATLTAKFEENLLDATQAWSKHIVHEDRLAGLPQTVRDMARQTAADRGLDGWLFTLEFPSYLGVMTYADDRELRQETYTAYVTRASDQGPFAGRWDNGPIMERILALRHQAARLLGFPNYAARSLATKMATRTDQVLDFLRDLARRSLPQAHKELRELREFAAKQGCVELEAWDVAYYSEKLRQAKYAFSEEDVRPYFPEPKVVAGLFAVVKRLYGLEIRERRDVPVWHEDVRFFEIYDGDGELRGQFYLDLFARPNKRGGAWMDDFRGRLRTPDGRLLPPVAFLTCNFTPPVGERPALLSHDEVITLFHEFGHGLHHMLTRVDYPSVAGIAGVPWDAVELPSQFMENFCWQREALDLISGHYESGEPLPDALLEKMLAARNFQSAMQMLRQLEFALFDFRLHLEYDPERGGRIYEILDEVRREVAVLHPPSFNRFPHSFAHIFAGGYAAGYYSYKWAEVLSADAFSAFEEAGIFDRETGLRFLTTILERGGSQDPMELFVEFRGREPVIDALLRHSGIVAEVGEDGQRPE